jgi:uncharacterized protein
MPEKNRLILQKIERSVKKAMSGEASGHDWWHVARVRQNALKIARSEPKASRFLVEAAALLHDLKDWKFAGGDAEAGARQALRLMRRMGASPEDARAVSAIVRQVSFKGAGVKDAPDSLEARIVQDADRLDALGALGIARCFAYGGMKKRAIYTPGEKPVLHGSFGSYKKSQSASISHFYEKLLLLRRRMRTAEGRRLAASRDAFMRAFLRRFYSEWKGSK